MHQEAVCVDEKMPLLASDFSLEGDSRLCWDTRPDRALAKIDCMGAIPSLQERNHIHELIQRLSNPVEYDGDGG